MIDSSSYEDELNILLERLSKMISTFGTLSREQAEIAILDTTSKIKEGESIIQKLEEELENDSKNRSPEELHEERQKIKNYKTEFNDIVNKFKVIQDNYINKKAKNALIDDETKPKAPDLLSNEERKNNFEIKEEDIQNDNNVKINEKKSEQNVFENNIGNLSGVNKITTLNDDTFFTFKRGRSNYKRKCIILWVIITVIVIVGLITILELKN
jgi:hypothetical protein